MHKGEEMLNQAQENATETQAASVRVKPGIDYEKLKSIGVPDEVIASLDPRDGGNITPQGEVLFLDEGRLHRRELPDKPLHENHPRGLGIKDFIMTKVLATTPKTWDRTLKVFMMIVSGAKLTGKEGIIPELYKRVLNSRPMKKRTRTALCCPLMWTWSRKAKPRFCP